MASSSANRVTSHESRATDATRPPAGYVTVAEAARTLGISHRAVQVRCAKRQLAFVQCAGTYYIDPDSAPALRLAAGRPDAGVDLAGSPLAGTTRRKRTVAAHRREICEQYLAAETHKPAHWTKRQFKTHWVDLRNRQLPQARRLSRATLERWLTNYREQGVAGLIDGRTNHGQAVISPECLNYILGVFAEQHGRASIASLYERAEALAPAEGWTLPSLRTVQRMVAERCDPRLVELIRDPQKYRDRMLPTVERDWSLVPSMQMWVADHRTLDLWVPRPGAPDRQGRVTYSWHRPVLTLFLDGRSWMPVGWRIEWDAPNAQRVMDTFVQAVNTHGLPEILYLDNGKDFRASRFGGGRRKKGETTAQQAESMLGLLGVDVIWALPYNARAKIVERFFKIVSAHFDRTWPIYCGDRSEHRPEHLAKEDANDHASALGLEDVQQVFDVWVNEDYALRECPSRHCKPRSVARAFVELRAADYTERRPSPADLSLLLMQSRSVRVEPNGIYIQAFGRYYNSDHESFEERRCASGRDRRRHVRYRYDPADPGQVYVFDDQDRFLCLATPYIGSGIHPAAAIVGDDDSQERLGQVLAANRRRHKTDRDTVQDLRRYAGNYLMANQVMAARATGKHDTDAPRDAGRPAGGTVIPMIADGQLTEATRAKDAHDQAAARRERSTRPNIADWLATGTDDPDSPPSAPRRNRSALDDLADATPQPQENTHASQTD